jgi:CheY-like chemotaxis protein
VAETLFEELKRYVSFGPADEDALRTLHPIARPDFERISEVFYARILEHEDAKKALFEGESMVGRLRHSLVLWTDKLLTGPWDEAYYQLRAKIGRKHVVIALPQHYMFGAMNVLRQELNLIADEAFMGSIPALIRVRLAVGKILDLELAIMLHTYREDLLAQQGRNERLATFGQLVGSIGHELRNPLGVMESSLYILRGRIPEGDARARKHVDRIGEQLTVANTIIADLLDMIREKPLQSGVARAAAGGPRRQVPAAAGVRQPALQRARRRRARRLDRAGRGGHRRLGVGWSLRRRTGRRPFGARAAVRAAGDHPAEGHRPGTRAGEAHRRASRRHRRLRASRPGRALRGAAVPKRAMRHFLFVDDNAAFVENLAEIIRDSGDQVTVATDGAHAVALAQTTRFDALVTDMRMPVMNGAGLMHEIRRADPGLPAVVVTAFTGEADLLAARQEGLLAVLPKPVPIDVLLFLLAKARRDGLVALVDDDAALADNLTEALQDRGFSSVTAGSLAAAERLGGLKPFVALVDLRLPGSADGAALGTLLRRMPRLPVLVMSGHQEAIDRVGWAQSFCKPFDSVKLLDAVEALWH